MLQVGTADVSIGSISSNRPSLCDVASKVSVDSSVCDVASTVLAFSRCINVEESTAKLKALSLQKECTEDGEDKSHCSA